MANPDGLSRKDIREIKAGIADIQAGRFYTREQVLKKLGIRLEKNRKDRK